MMRSNAVLKHIKPRKCRDRTETAGTARRLQNSTGTPYPTVPAIFGRIGRICSEEVLLQLINSKCLPMLIYGIEVCPLRKSDLRALDFVVDRFFMKLFQTGNIEVVRLAQRMVGFALPSFLIEKSSNKFYTVK